MKNLVHLYQSYKRCLVRITVKNDLGDLSTGTAFHIGDGWLATARHVVEGYDIEEIISEYCSKKLTAAQIIYHSNPLVDLAVIRTDLNLAHYMEKVTIVNPPDGFVKADHIVFGDHLDDWLGDELCLSKVLLMGYPPVPFSGRAELIAAEGEINAVIDKYNAPHPHFIISCMSRGGFSGGPVLSEYGFLLGVLTESLIHDSRDEELGYSAAVSIEPLLELLHSNGVYPGDNRELLEVIYDGKEFSCSPQKTRNKTKLYRQLRKETRFR